MAARGGAGAPSSDDAAAGTDPPPERERKAGVAASEVRHDAVSFEDNPLHGSDRHGNSFDVEQARAVEHGEPNQEGQPLACTMAFATAVLGAMAFLVLGMVTVCAVAAEPACSVKLDVRSGVFLLAGITVSLSVIGCVISLLALHVQAPVHRLRTNASSVVAVDAARNEVHELAVVDNGDSSERTVSDMRIFHHCYQVLLHAWLMMFATDEELWAQFVVIVVIFVVGSIAILTDGSEGGAQRGLPARDTELKTVVVLSQMILVVGLLATLSTWEATAWMVTTMLMALAVMLLLWACTLGVHGVRTNVRTDILKLAIGLLTTYTALYTMAALIGQSMYAWLLGFVLVEIYVAVVFVSIETTPEQ